MENWSNANENRLVGLFGGNGGFLDGLGFLLLLCDAAFLDIVAAEAHRSDMANMAMI